MFVSVSRVVTLAACMYIRLLLTYSFPQPEIGLALCIGMRSETLERIHVRIGINTPPRTSQYDAWDRWCSAKSRKFLYRSFTLKKCPTLHGKSTTICIFGASQGTEWTSPSASRSGSIAFLQNLAFVLCVPMKREHGDFIPEHSLNKGAGRAMESQLRYFHIGVLLCDVDARPPPD